MLGDVVDYVTVDHLSIIDRREENSENMKEKIITSLQNSLVLKSYCEKKFKKFE